MKRAAQSAFWILLISGIIGWFAYTKFTASQKEKASEKQRAQQTAFNQQKVADFATRYNAVTDWQDRLEKHTSGLGSGYSLGVEETLEDPSGRPILITGFIDDVFRRDGDYFITISDVGGGSLQFVLSCDSAVAKQAAKSDSGYADFAVVATISSVEKAALKLKSGVKKTEDDAPIDVDMSDLFVVHGHCLDVIQTSTE